MVRPLRLAHATALLHACGGAMRDRAAPVMRQQTRMLTPLPLPPSLPWHRSMSAHAAAAVAVPAERLTAWVPPPSPRRPAPIPIPHASVPSPLPAPSPFPASSSPTPPPAPSTSNPTSSASTKPKAFQQLLRNLKGTVLEAMAATVPKGDRLFFASRWGFVIPDTEPVQGTQRAQAAHAAAAVTGPGPSTPSAAASAAAAPLQPKVTAVLTATAVQRQKEELPASSAGPVATHSSSSSSSSSPPNQLGMQADAVGQCSLPQEAAPPGTAPAPAASAALPAQVLGPEVTSAVGAAPAAAVAVAAKPAHPLLGVPVSELGYKTVYACSVHNLIKVPIWRRQRIFRPERSRKIAQCKLKAAAAGGRQLGMPGVITLCEDVESGSLGIVDGQHRLGALILLCESKNWDQFAANVTVDVFRTRSEQDVKDLFVDINSAEPVKLVDMPGEGADDDAAAVLAEAVEVLAARYPEMFKPSQRCRPPHLNKDNLRDAIFQGELLSRHGLRTAPQLVAHLEAVNKQLGGRKEREWDESNCRLSPSAKAAAFRDALAKATEHGVFLGLDKTWMHR